MPINGAISTLPDREYISQLEAELAWLRRQVEQNARDISNLNRGR